jgi:ferredoxin
VRVTIDGHRCAGHGRCYTVAPEVFESDDEGRGVVIVPLPRTDDLARAARQAAANCPESAIDIS